MSAPSGDAPSLQPLRPFAVWLASRSLLCVACFLALQFATPLTEGGRWRAFPENAWLDGWLRWDVSWYASIADGGYVAPEARIDGETRNTAFFPLYPLAMRALTPLTGSALTAGLIVSNACFLIALIYFHAFVVSRFGASVALRALILLSVSPFALFFSSAYTESLFLALVLAAFHYGERRRWLIAGTLAGLAGLTRVAGFITALALCILYWRDRPARDRMLDRSALSLMAGFVGPLIHVVYLQARYGNGLEFVVAQSARDWNVAWAFPRSLNDWQHWVLLLGAIALSAAATARIGRAYGFWGTTTGLLSLSKMQSGGRLATVLFPATAMLAHLLRNPYAFWCTVTLFLALSIYNTVRFALWHWVA